MVSEPTAVDSVIFCSSRHGLAPQVPLPAMTSPDLSLPLVTIHRIDANRRLCYLDAGFRQAALAAGVGDLPGRVLGTSLFSHLTGAPTKEWYRHLLDHVAKQGTASFEFHCDTPTIVRVQRMDIRLLDGGFMEFTAVTLSSTSRHPARVLDWSLTRSSRHILMCSCCLRVSTVIGWLDVEQAAQVLQVFQDAIPPTIDYTICDEDREQLAKIITQRPE